MRCNHSTKRAKTLALLTLKDGAATIKTLCSLTMCNEQLMKTALKHLKKEGKVEMLRVKRGAYYALAVEGRSPQPNVRERIIQYLEENGPSKSAEVARQLHEPNGLVIGIARYWEKKGVFITYLVDSRRWLSLPGQTMSFEACDRLNSR